MFFIRKANPEDYADIATIHFKSWHAAYLGLLPASYININDKNTLCKKKKMWQGLMAHPDVSVWIACDAHHHNLGFIGYFTNHKDYEITTLYVLPDYQGLGIGTQLMTASLQALLESHINAHFSLWVLEANVAAIDFYQKFGFVGNGEKSEECYKNMQIIDIKMVSKFDDLTS